MKHPLIMASAILGLTACDPDLGANPAQRCGVAEPCAEGEACYRGFCLPDAVRVLEAAQGGDASVIYVEVESDGSVILVEVPVAATGAGDASSSVEPWTDVDAGSVTAPDASTTPVDPSVPPTRADASVSLPDASLPGPRDASLPTPRDASLPSPPDASLPDAAPPRPCSEKECCDEARKWAEGRDRGRKPCGCDNLLQSLTCNLLFVGQP